MVHYVNRLANVAGRMTVYPLKVALALNQDGSNVHGSKPIFVRAPGQAAKILKFIPRKVPTRETGFP